MIAFPAGVRVWIAGGVTDMRRGMNTLALTVQQGGVDVVAGGMVLSDGAAVGGLRALVGDAAATGTAPRASGTCRGRVPSARVVRLDPLLVRVRVEKDTLRVLPIPAGAPPLLRQRRQRGGDRVVEDLPHASVVHA